ncbi:MAG: hypothetical protein E6I03_12230 [Chloroflexi bacterium]|nr:MAG: hypothetical protein E6I03_12230 [Chloroflexota bacterium]
MLVSTYASQRVVNWNGLRLSTVVRKLWRKVPGIAGLPLYALNHSQKLAEAEKPPPKAVIQPGVVEVPRGQLLRRP